MNNNISQEQQHQQPQQEDQDRARCEWSFSLAASISPRTREVSDVLGAVELEPSDRLLATGGISRKIRIYNLRSLLNRQETTSEDFYICTPAKLSSLRWRPESGTSLTIAAGDYDGVVTEYDIGRRIPVSERDEHGGRRVWCVDYSAAGDLAASASDDGTAHIWDPRCPGGGSSVSIISSSNAPGAPVCSVEFNKSDKIQVGVACADKCAYIYDLRNMKQPVLIFSGHQKTVTYLRFADNGRVVTSSVDGCHRMWNVSNGEEVRVYRGHRNARSFVGMDVCNGGGLIGSGSESNEVFVYDLRWGDPIWVQDFGEEDGREFVSAVCWREIGENECALVAGGSNGVVKIFDGRRIV